jgi:hypothetical protein
MRKQKIFSGASEKEVTGNIVKWVADDPSVLILNKMIRPKTSFGATQPGPDALSCIDQCFIADDMLEHLPLASQVGKILVGGIDLNKARMRQVVQALIALSPLPNGFTASDVAVRVRALSKQSPCQYGPRHAAYDLKKLRGKQIVRRIGHTRRLAQRLADEANRLVVTNAPASWFQRITCDRCGKDRFPSLAEPSGRGPPSPAHGRCLPLCPLRTDARHAARPSGG